MYTITPGGGMYNIKHKNNCMAELKDSQASFYIYHLYQLTSKLCLIYSNNQGKRFPHSSVKYNTIYSKFTILCACT